VGEDAVEPTLDPVRRRLLVGSVLDSMDQELAEPS